VARVEILGPEAEAAMLEFLRQRVEHSMFLLSNLAEAGFEASDHRRSGVYVGALEGDAIVGVACHYRMGNIVVNAPRHAAVLARALVDASGRRIAGVVGPAPEVAQIVTALDLPHGADAQLDESEVLYRLALDQLRVPAALRDGEVRGRELAVADVEQVSEWMLRYCVEAIGDVETEALREKVRAEQVAALGRGEVFVLEHEGRLVARTGFNARLPDAVQIGGVWTPHELRGRGYARCVVAAHLLAAREAGVRTAILFTEHSNTPARRAYAALGFAEIGRYRLLMLRG
jgi:uncharacterized protein